MKNSNFFDRVLQIIDFYNINSVTDFAKNRLGYKSPEKINRLKKEGAKPSMDIINDISNKFEHINVRWLVTGRGDMIIGDPDYPHYIPDDERMEFKEVHNNIHTSSEAQCVEEPTVNYQTNEVMNLLEKIELLEGRLSDKDKLIESLESQIEMMQLALKNCDPKKKEANAG